MPDLDDEFIATPETTLVTSTDADHKLRCEPQITSGCFVYILFLLLVNC